MQHNHYLIIQPEHEAFVKSVVPDAIIKNGRFYPTLYAYGPQSDLYAAQMLLKEEMNDRRTMLIKLRPPVEQNHTKPLSQTESAGI